jgi:hypothetical protein
MSTVSPLSGISPVGSSTSDGNNRGSFFQPPQGQIFKAMVTEAKSPTMFILDIAGQKIPAHSKNELSVGQTLKLQVLNTSPQVELKIINDSNNLLAGKSIKLLGENIDIRALFSSFQKITPSPLENISVLSRQTLESFFRFNQNQLSGKDGGALLKQFIDRLGLSFEALLAKGEAGGAKHTLKSALLELAQAFRNADQLAENTTKLLNTLELYQLAQLQLDKDNVFIFPLPIPFLEKGYLLVEEHENGKDTAKQDEQRFSLHLSLDGLGNLRIDILKSPEGVYLRFLSDSKEKLQFIETFKDDLLLNTVDSYILGVSFSQEPLDTATDLLKKLLPEGESLINTKV